MISGIMKGINKLMAGYQSNYTTPVSVAGVKFNTNKTDFIRYTLLPAASENIFLGDDGSVRHIGIIQLDIFIPLGIGLNNVMTHLDNIENYFIQGMFSDCVRIGITSIEPAYEDEGWYIQPVTINYMVYTDKVTGN